MAEPTQREIDLARELDREIVEEETGEADIEEMTERVTALIARKLAAYRVELLGTERDRVRFVRSMYVSPDGSSPSFGVSTAVPVDEEERHG